MIGLELELDGGKMERKIKDKGFKLSETTGENYLMLFKDTPVKFLFYYYPYKIPI